MTEQEDLTNREIETRLDELAKESRELIQQNMDRFCDEVQMFIGSRVSSSQDVVDERQSRRRRLDPCPSESLTVNERFVRIAAVAVARIPTASYAFKESFDGPLDAAYINAFKQHFLFEALVTEFTHLFNSGNLTLNVVIQLEVMLEDVKRELDSITNAPNARTDRADSSAVSSARRERRQAGARTGDAIDEDERPDDLISVSKAAVLVAELINDVCSDDTVRRRMEPEGGKPALLTRYIDIGVSTVSEAQVRAKAHRVKKTVGRHKRS